MEFIIPTVEELSEMLEQGIASGEATLDDMRQEYKRVQADEFFDDPFYMERVQETNLSTLKQENFTASCSPAYLGSERLKVDKFELVPIARFKKDGYVYFSDGIHAISLTELADNIAESLKQVLAKHEGE